MDKKDFKRTLVTAALPYANGPVHIGHLAGVYVPADIYVRYKRLQGENVLLWVVAMSMVCLSLSAPVKRVARCKILWIVTTI